MGRRADVRAVWVAQSRLHITLSTRALRFFEDKEHGAPEAIRTSLPTHVRRRPLRLDRPNIVLGLSTDSRRNSEWYYESRMVTVNDIYAFESERAPDARSVQGHHRAPLQRQPKEGLRLTTIVPRRTCSARSRCRIIRSSIRCRQEFLMRCRSAVVAIFMSLVAAPAACGRCAGRDACR